MGKAIDKILSTIDGAIASFQNDIPGIQKNIYEAIQPIIKNLEIGGNGRLLNNLKNLKLIIEVQKKLERVILESGYKKTVQNFIDNFLVLATFNHDYFAQFNKKFKPSNVLPVIKELSVNSTINDLIGQGLNSNVIVPVEKILQQIITTGGSYVDFHEVLRNHILTNESGEGNLQRYTKQISTDAINQFNAQYSEAIAQDLQFNWGQYIGSLLTTSREFCVLLTEKRYVHKSELPGIIAGNIDGVELKLSKTTGLPLGMIPGTNAANFKVRRGGYQCGHQFFWVPDSSVPENIKLGLGAPVTRSVFTKKEAEKLL